MMQGKWPKTSGDDTVPLDATRCDHSNSHSTGVVYDDWWDGDSDEQRQCNECGEKFWVYIPR